MNHPSPEQLWLLAHDALEAQEARSVLAHLESGCAACAAALVAAERDAATLALGADPREPGAHVRERLVERTLGRPARAALPLPARSFSVPIPLAAGLVGLGLALGSATTWLGMVSPGEERIAAAEETAAEAQREHDLAIAALEERTAAPNRALRREREDLLAELAREREAVLEARARANGLSQENRALSLALARFEDRLTDHERAAARLATERDALSLALEDADEALELLESPGVEWVVLSSDDDATKGKARFFWEWDRRNCLIDGNDLPGIAEGQAYALWVAYEDGEPTLVDTFAPDQSGSARLLADLPEGEGEVRSVRITLEDAPDPAAPQGVTLLAGVLF